MSRKSAFSHRRSPNANFSPHSTPDLRLILPASAGPGDPTGTWVPADIRFSEKDVPIMKNLKQVRKTNDPSRPVWCAACSVRIAPSERHTIQSGKSYHQVCYAKLRK